MSVMTAGTGALSTKDNDILETPPPNINILHSFDDGEEDLEEIGVVDDVDQLLGYVESHEVDSGDVGPPPDDEEADTAAATAGSNASPTQSRTSIPTWLASHYREMCEQLRSEMNKNPSKRPTCYDAGTFSITPKNPIISTQQVFQVQPKHFQAPEFFVWLPHVLGKIPCPACKKAGRHYQKGGTVMLQHHGWPRAPRRIADIDRTIYIIGYRFFCGQCQKTYQSWSPAILESLPTMVAAQFPFHLTYRSGVTDGLFALLRSSFQRGLGPTPFADMIRTFHIRRYEQLQLQFYEMVNIRLESGCAPWLAAHQRFGAWNDREGYGGYVPSGRYFSDIYNLMIEKHGSEIDQRMAMLSARLLAIDHSHKVRDFD